jgi:hypothetical protein
LYAAKTKTLNSGSISSQFNFCVLVVAFDFVQPTDRQHGQHYSKRDHAYDENVEQFTHRSQPNIDTGKHDYQARQCYAEPNKTVI